MYGYETDGGLCATRSRSRIYYWFFAHQPRAWGSTLRNRRTLHRQLCRHVLLTPAATPAKAVRFSGDQSCPLFPPPFLARRNAPNLAVNYGGAFSAGARRRLSIPPSRPTYATDAFLCGRLPLFPSPFASPRHRYPVAQIGWVDRSADIFIALLSCPYALLPLFTASFLALFILCCL